MASRYILRAIRISPRSSVVNWRVGGGAVLVLSTRELPACASAAEQTPAAKTTAKNLEPITVLLRLLFKHTQQTVEEALLFGFFLRLRRICISRLKGRHGRGVALRHDGRRRRHVTCRSAGHKIGRASCR